VERRLVPVNDTKNCGAEVLYQFPSLVQIYVLKWQKEKERKGKKKDI
jgi:hypothetical protein